MDEHQLFELALAATINELDLAFYLKEGQNMRSNRSFA